MDKSQKQAKTILAIFDNRSTNVKQVAFWVVHLAGLSLPQMIDFARWIEHEAKILLKEDE